MTQQTTQFTKTQTDYADRIEAAASPSLAKWVRQQFEMGCTLESVKQQFDLASTTTTN
jgi:hypothetical protein